jgi:phenylpyruvate tautomerase PptA (4-oxalocrotonate tautomerase family)
MPHLTVHALEGDLAGREAALAEALTASVAAVYGQWARELVSVQLIGLPTGRWAIGGQLVQTTSPAITFSVREAMFTRPDAHELIPLLIASVTDAVASVVGEQSRAGISVELVATPAGRTGLGGVLV